MSKYHQINKKKILINLLIYLYYKINKLQKIF